MSPTRSERPAWWPVILASSAGAVVLAFLGAPSPVLFGALFGSLLVAVSPLATPLMPPRVSTFAQGLLGISIGGIIDPDTLAGFARNAGPVAFAVAATIAASILIGQVLRWQGVTPATATFSFIAGGASGVTAVAGELGADERIVAVVQYLRVLIIIVGMPLVASAVFGVPLSERPPDDASPLVRWVDSVVGAFAEVTLSAVAFAVICLVLGLALARLIRFPASSLLVPLALAAVFAVTGVFDPFLGPEASHLPAALEALAFGLIGLQVGLRFTRESLLAVSRILPLATVGILVLIVVSAGFGVVLADAIGVSRLDGYLATTPGGLYAVLVTATIAGGDVTFVLAVQVMRFVLILALAPVLAEYYRRRFRAS